MKDRFLSQLLLSILPGLLVVSFAQAQQVVRNDFPNKDSAAKSCIVVYGAVKSPTRFELQRQVRLAEAIAAAGGLSGRAGKTVQLIHYGQDLKCDQWTDVTARVRIETFELTDLVSGNQDKNPYLQAGDMIVVSEGPVVYVVGSVVAPQSLPFRDGLTLARALAMTGGVTRNSNQKRVTIIRNRDENSTRMEITIDLNAIRKHRIEDPLLQPNDIVEVPERHGGDRFTPLGPIMFDSRQLPLRSIT